VLTFDVPFVALERLARGVAGARPMSRPRPAHDVPLEETTTIELLARAKNGDDASLYALFRRCIPALRRWAHGRLPSYARDLLDTHDLVQETVVNLLRRIHSFGPEHDGAVHAYLRQAVLNRIRDEVRRRQRRPVPVELPESMPAPQSSPLEDAIGREAVSRYERALQALRPEDREAIVGRVELQYSFKELAAFLGKPSDDAARVAVTRAIARLAKEMGSRGAD
jgi:RNA polymerase sigma-70 factor (ECF subfamily)